MKKELIGSDEEEIEITNEEIEEAIEDDDTVNIRKKYTEIKEEEIKEVAEDELFTFI